MSYVCVWKLAEYSAEKIGDRIGQTVLRLFQELKARGIPFVCVELRENRMLVYTDPVTRCPWSSKKYWPVVSLLPWCYLIIKLQDYESCILERKIPFQVTNIFIVELEFFSCELKVKIH